MPMVKLYPSLKFSFTLSPKLMRLTALHTLAVTFTGVFAPAVMLKGDEPL